MKLTTLLAVLAAGFLMPAGIQAETAFALNGRNMLIRIDTNTPGFTDGNTGQNLRLHPDTGAVAAVDGRLNSDTITDFKIVGAAYTNSVAGATTTVLYGIDAELRSLVTQVPPNDGKLNRVGMMNIDMSEVAGFDISPRTGMAFVAARVRGSAMAALYEVNLNTGAAMQLGVFDRLDQIGGLAIPPRLP